MKTESTEVNVPLHVDEVFRALEAWIKQRPGLDWRNYYDRAYTRNEWGKLAPSDGLRAYRTEIREIGKHRHRALSALDEARGLTPARPDLLADAFRAFSGRLQWLVGESDWAVTPDYTCPCGMYVHPSKRSDIQWHIKDCQYYNHGQIHYTTGQYWPTEYRKAATAVLEAYIAGWKKAEAAEHPPTFTYRTMDDVMY